MDTQNLYLFVKGRLIAIPDDYLGVFHWVWRRDGDDAHTLRITIQQPRPRQPDEATEEDRAALKKSSRPRLTRSGREHPGASVDIWAMDEHRIGLTPILCGACGHRSENGRSRSAIIEWLYVTCFVAPATGRAVWNIVNAVCKELFELILVDFARSVGAGNDKRIVLQLDKAGWHGPENLAMPDGSRLPSPPTVPNSSPPNIFGGSRFNAWLFANGRRFRRLHQRRSECRPVQALSVS
jgi:hypothetical protein